MNVINDKTNPSLLFYQTQRLSALLHEIQNCCQEKRQSESKVFRMPYAELNCLKIFREARYLTVKDIARKLEVAKSRVTKIINGLIARKIIQRTDDPQDGRVRLLSLTPAGQKKCKQIEEFQNNLHTQILLEIPVDERESLISNMEKLRVAMKAVKNKLEANPHQENGPLNPDESTL